MSRTSTPRTGVCAHLLLVLFLELTLAACASVPITGRSQFILVGELEERQMGLKAFRQALTGQPSSRDPGRSALVRRVGSRIAQATGRTDLDWEFRLVEKDVKDAWSAPGGKVVVYTGILDVTGDEAGLAALLGHEVAHVVARHGAERLSQRLLADLSVTAAAGTNAHMDKAGAKERVSALPSPLLQEQELEADRMGLTYMAKAGYDPRAAASLWRRMVAGGNGGRPEFPPTSPAAEARIRNVERWLPEAMRHFDAPK